MKKILCLILICCIVFDGAAAESDPILHPHLRNATNGNFSSSFAVTNFATTVNDSSAEVDQLVSGVGADASILLSLLIGFLSIFTVAGNVMVILAVVIFRKLRRINNLLIVSLATADLIMGGVVLTLGLHYAVGSKWLLGNLACDLWTSIDVLSVTASICTLCAISLDRFVAIVMPFEYSTKMTRNRIRLIIVFIWVMSATIAFVPINMGWWKTDETYDKECYDDPTCCEFRINKTYAVVSSLVSFYIPLIVMIFSYSIVFKIAIQKRKKICNREGVYRRASMPGSRSLLWGRGEYRAVFTMGIIMGTFVVCWLPFFIANIIQVFCDRCIDSTVFTVLNWIGYMNSCFNPVIYCHSIEFRRAFKRLLMCGLCREGYQQTSRASLSISYTPSISVRSSIRTESSLFQFTNFFLQRKSSTQRRVSTASNKQKKSPPLGDCFVNREGTPDLKMNNNHVTNGEAKTGPPVDSLKVNLTSRYYPRTDEIVTRRSCSGESNPNRLKDLRLMSSSTSRPVIVYKEKRSLSTFDRAPTYKRVLFKTSSQNDLPCEVSAEKSHFLPVERFDDSSRSSVETTLLEESRDLNESRTSDPPHSADGSSESKPE